MSESLRLRLVMAPNGIRIIAQGDIEASNAHLLSKVVVATLRRHAPPALEVDLHDTGSIDPVGAAAILDCRRDAERRGVLFRLIGTSQQIQRVLAECGGLEPAGRPQRAPRQPQTGTFCH